MSVHRPRTIHQCVRFILSFVVAFTMMDELPRAKRNRELTSADEFYLLAKDVQRRTGQKIIAEQGEDRRFHEFFGTGVAVAINAWTLLVEHERLEENAEISHLLWAMYFLKCYPKTGEGCAAAASEKGAVDPKTWRKYIWPMIYALADLESILVSSRLIFSFP